MKRIMWGRSHESCVENFYGTGVQNYGEFHGGYLNFGLWDPGITNYLDAAENLVKYIGKRLGLKKDSQVLDVACGMGAQDILLHRTFGCKISAVDVTWKHVKHAQKRINEAGVNKHVKVQHGTAVRLPFPDNTFTHVMSIEGPEHFNTREKFFREAHRVLKPGGVMVLADYSLKRRPRKLWEHLVVNLTAKLWHVPKANHDTNNTYKMKMTRSGFTNIDFEEVGSRTIPGYYFEQKKPRTRRAIRKIRGWMSAYPGHIIDIGVYYAFKLGLIEYIVVRAEK